MSEQIVAEYRKGSPTRANSRELVKLIASGNGMSEAKVRSVLVKSGTYVALPKDKAKIDDADYDAILKRYASYRGLNGDDEYGPDELMTELASEFGYGKWALGEFYRTYRDLGKPRNARIMKAEQTRRSKREHDNLMAPFNRRSKAIEREHQLRMANIKLGSMSNHIGIFNPDIAVWILIFFVICCLGAAFNL